MKEIKMEKSKNPTTNFLWNSTFIISRIGADHDRPSDFTKILGFHFLASWCQTREEMVACSLDLLDYSQPSCVQNDRFLCPEQGFLCPAHKQGLCQLNLAYIFYFIHLDFINNPRYVFDFNQHES